jgi:hypothetical protein
MQICENRKSRWIAYRIIDKTCSAHEPAIGPGRFPSDGQRQWSNELGAAVGLADLKSLSRTLDALLQAMSTARRERSDRF